MTTKHEHHNVAQARRTAGLCLVFLALSALLTTQPASAGVPSFQGLRDLPGAGVDSRAFGITADGSAVVGRGSSVASGASTGFSEAFRWTAGGGIVGLGDLPGGSFDSSASDVSADGSTVVGSSNSGSGNEAFRWENGVMTGLGDLPGGVFRSTAWGISADGSTVVGSSDSGSGNEAFRWSAGAMMDLGDLFGGGFNSTAFDVSADGSVVVGRGLSTSGFEAFRWENDVMTGLGDLPGGAFASAAFDVSPDGSVVVGLANTASGNEAFIWDAVNGMRSLLDVLVIDLGIDLTGWTLTVAERISADGMTIVGTGVNPAGNTEAWIATIPEPATLSLLAFGGLALLRRRRRAV